MMINGTLAKDALELWEHHERIGLVVASFTNRTLTLRNFIMCNAQMIRNQLCARQEKKEKVLNNTWKRFLM